MIDVAKLIHSAVQGVGGEKVVVAAPYDLGDFMCREIAASSGLSGYIANSAPDPKDRNPLVADGG